jgi:hypothetical protein
MDMFLINIDNKEIYELLLFSHPERTLSLSKCCFRIYKLKKETK